MAPFAQDARWTSRHTASVRLICPVGRPWGRPALGGQGSPEAQSAEGGPSANTRRRVSAPAPIIFLPRDPACPSGGRPGTEPGTQPSAGRPRGTDATPTSSPYLRRFLLGTATRRSPGPRPRLPAARSRPASGTGILFTGRDTRSHRVTVWGSGKVSPWRHLPPPRPPPRGDLGKMGGKGLGC